MTEGQEDPNEQAQDPTPDPEEAYSDEDEGWRRLEMAEKQLAEQRQEIEDLKAKIQAPPDPTPDPDPEDQPKRPGLFKPGVLKRR